MTSHQSSTDEARRPITIRVVASLDDLACMKLSIIAGRGAARDFWDLHTIVTRTARPLGEFLEAFKRKYPVEDIGHIVRSLVYFGDASGPLPAGLTSERWEELTRTPIHDVRWQATALRRPCRRINGPRIRHDRDRTAWLFFDWANRRSRRSFQCRQVRGLPSSEFYLLRCYRWIPVNKSACSSLSVRRALNHGNAGTGTHGAETGLATVADGAISASSGR